MTTKLLVKRKPQKEGKSKIAVGGGHPAIASRQGVSKVINQGNKCLRIGFFGIFGHISDVPDGMGNP